MVFLCLRVLNDFYGNRLSRRLVICLQHGLKRKSYLSIPRKEIARPQSQFPHSCVRGIADRSWEYINCSQTHECGNWDWDLAIPFLGIKSFIFGTNAVSYIFSWSQCDESKKLLFNMYLFYLIWSLIAVACRIGLTCTSNKSKSISSFYSWDRICKLLRSLQKSIP